MRRRIFRNFRVFLLIFATLALVCHMIIPHDHHLADSDTLPEGKCQVPFNSSNHHSGFPFHCHAFSDLASEKAVSYCIIRNIQCRDFVPGSIIDLTFFNLQISGLSIFDVTEQPVDSFLLELSSLRAPPSNC